MTTAIFLIGLAFLLASVNADAKRCPTDIVYLVDQSTSITKSVYTNRVIPFLQNAISELNIDEKGDHVAVIRFSSPVETTVDFHFETDKSQILASVRNLRYAGGNTATVRALQLAQNNVFVSEQARRALYGKSVAPIAVIITDGVATDGNAAESANRLASNGVTIFAVGVGPIVSREYLEEVAGSASRVFKVENVNEFNQALDKTISESIKCD